MDVHQLIDRSGGAAGASPITNLNGRTGTPRIGAAQWNDAMNRATAARGSIGGVGDVNDARTSDAQRATLQGDLNHRLATPPGAPVAHAPTADDEKLEAVASTLVNQLFMGSMMKQMRDSPFKDDTFSGGKAGDAYAGMLDQRISEHSGNRIARSLVNAMVKAYRKERDAAPGEPLFPIDPPTQPAARRSAATEQVQHDTRIAPVAA